MLVAFNMQRTQISKTSVQVSRDRGHENTQPLSHQKLSQHLGLDGNCNSCEHWPKSCPPPPPGPFHPHSNTTPVLEPFVPFLITLNFLIRSHYIKCIYTPQTVTNVCELFSSVYCSNIILQISKSFATDCPQCDVDQSRT